jgi:hypothetical protein
MEQRVFSFGRPTAFGDVYLPITNAEYSDEITRSAKQLASVVLTMNEYPLIRYRKDSEKCKALAMQTEVPPSSRSQHLLCACSMQTRDAEPVCM